ncbi:MAG TPA: urease accessory protein UreF [Oscillatoriaceae cyanobacterium M33_DOE_052]|uniref:Urease accessory protein UreF n=1 Tax=Planktothricoides sp. SpSt-374 TaxID=2282167 RepID=A0A7C3ZW57_9CYAN|nr:urease accessory protein UreF [Oscillatoriaceae cyanobacterium M33_DOE_052]
MLNNFSLLALLQLASTSLPVGAYSYSEGLEFLVEQGVINNAEDLKKWIESSLQEGGIYLDAAVMLRSLRAAALGDTARLKYWNNWASASRETEELRQQSWQMGNALMRLFLALIPDSEAVIAHHWQEQECNFSIAFGIAAAYWQIPTESAILGYLQSWTSNCIGAGVKLIPLGQTAGQQLLLNLQPILVAAAQDILTVADEDLSSCTWGLSLASMHHETQYSRLFRS